MYEDAFTVKVKRVEDFYQKLANTRRHPSILAMWNFVVERAAIQSICREVGINIVHLEDGWFPHYGSAHADPMGFCWESSIPRLVFRELNDILRKRAHETRRKWLQFKGRELPSNLKKPFVLWPLQLLGDKVNRLDINASDWAPYLMHFRQCLPNDFQLVVKPHPRSGVEYNKTLGHAIGAMGNTILLPKSPAVHLKTLLSEASGVAGMNSTVLLEARLMFHLPVWAYGRSWYDNHTDLVPPVAFQFEPRPLPRLDWLESPEAIRSEYLNDYADWFLSQLLARQLAEERDSTDPEVIRQKVERLSYHSYLEHGEAIFRAGLILFYTDGRIYPQMATDPVV